MPNAEQQSKQEKTEAARISEIKHTKIADLATLFRLLGCRMVWNMRKRGVYVAPIQRNKRYAA
jgi:hypothetical protein